MAETGAEASRVAAPQKMSASLMQRAKKSDSQALVTIFRQFIPEEERIYWTEYLGSHGWIFGRHSLGCLTNKRLAGITIGSFGEVIYRDGYLEYINSSVIYQPSKLALYIYVFIAIILDLGISFSGASAAAVGLGWGLLGVLFVGVLLFVALGILLVNLVV